MSSRIEKDEQGVYTWTATVDARYEHKAFRIAFGVTGGICGMYLLMSLALGGDMLGLDLAVVMEQTIKGMQEHKEELGF